MREFMARRYESTAKQFALLDPVRGKRGGGWNDHHTTFNGIFWWLYSGARWREVPGRYGPWQSVYDRLNLCPGRRHAQPPPGTAAPAFELAPPRSRRAGRPGANSWPLPWRRCACPTAKAGRPVAPGNLAGDKGYSYPRVRAYLRRRGNVPVIPTREDQRANPRFDKEAYRQRNAIERCVGWLKENRQLATHHAKPAANYPS